MTLPTVITALLGLLISIAGIVVIVRPSRVSDVADRFSSTSAIKAGTILGRIAIGILLLLAAPDTRLPTFMTILGFLSIVAGVALAIMKEAWVNWTSRGGGLINRKLFCVSGACSSLYSAE